MLQVSHADGKWKVEPLWSNTNLRCKFSSPVFRAGFIYGLDEAHLVCLDAASGERKWKGDRYGFGQILLAGDAVLVGAENGRLVLVGAMPDRFRELAAIRALSGDKNWNHLAVSRGRALVRNHFEMACYQLPMPK
jgi:outer membrane protein assembly factor BamB